MSLLVVDHVSKSHVVSRNILRQVRKKVDAVRDVSLSVEAGRTLAVVGETGSGKSSLGRVLAGLDRADSGRVLFDGLDIAGKDRAVVRARQKRLQLLFQDPTSSLNPRLTVGRSIAEPMQVHLRLPADRVRDRVGRLLVDVGLSADLADRYPRQLSGGQRQRVAIARALGCEPDLLICDEIVSALDVSTQAQVLDLLRGLQKSRRLAMVFITHDLALLRGFADDVAVMYQGQIVEHRPVNEIIADPHHEYSRRLLSSVLSADLETVRSRPARRRHEDRDTEEGRHG